MGYVIGFLLALAAAGFGRYAGIHRDRAFYTTMVVVVASYYVLFAAMAGSSRTLVEESIAMAVFVALAAIGARRGPWWLVAGLAAHGLFDGFHDAVVTNPGVPAWWPAFCSAFDVSAAALLAIVVGRDARGEIRSGSAAGRLAHDELAR